MKISTLWMTTCAMALVGTAAMADCAADLASMTGASTEAMPAGATAEDPDGDGRPGIVQDGDLAPLQTAPAAGEAADDMAADDMADADTDTDSDDAMADADGADAMADTETDDATADADGGDAIAQDGLMSPLEGTTDQDRTAIATSGMDAQAQQDGGETAAEEAEDGRDTSMGDDSPQAGEDDAMAADSDMEAGDDAMAADSDMETEDGDDRTALIAEAEAALAAGDEAACQAALDRIDS